MMQRDPRVFEIFEAACNLDAGERAAYLSRACGDDVMLRDLVEQMLARDADDGAAIDTSARARVIDQLAAAASDAAGGDGDAVPQQIGPYRVLRMLGRGGMGVVYEAEQQSPRRTVALKVIRAEFASRALARRFELEAQLLGRLQHPGIAQVFEAGVAQTESGPRMFIAMELVRGQPLTAHAADPRRPLGVRERLALLARVCDAVQHAHQRGVIHRDLKPSNVLVVPDAADDGSSVDIAATTRGLSTGRGSGARSPDSMLGRRDARLAYVGQPKVLDFGVAREADAAAGATLHTVAGQLIGTVPYMSPEQVSGDPAEVDVRSDVFALGVMLYELLAGRFPHDADRLSLPDAIRAIREAEYRPLGAVRRELRGEIETITMRALEKDKSRRYQSAAELGADLRRHLLGEPVEARRDSNWYVLQKRLRRYRAATLVGAGVVVLLLASSVGMSLLYQQALENARVAGEATQAAELAREIAQRESERARAEARKAGAVSEALSRLFQSADPRSAQGRAPTVLEVLNDYAPRAIEALAREPSAQAAMQFTVGQTYHSLGDYPRAVELLRAAHASAMRQHGGRPSKEAADYAVGLSAVLGTMGELAEAEALLRAALETHSGLLGPKNPATAWDMHTLGNILVLQGRVDEAEPLMRESLALTRELDAAGTLANPEQSELAEALLSLVQLLYQRRAMEEAEPLAREALAVTRERLGEDHPTTAVACNNLAAVLVARGKADEAGPLYEAAIDIVRRARGDDHPDVAAGLTNIGLYYVDHDQLEKAEAAYRESLEIRRARLPAGHPQIGESLSGLGNSLNQMGRAAEAEPVLREAAAIRTAALPAGDVRAAFTRSFLGAALTALGRHDEAAPILSEAYDTISAKRGPKHQYALAALRNLATSLEALGRAEEAAERRAALGEK